MLASLPLPVAVVSAASGAERSCSTATVSYVSVDPPLVSTALSATGRTRRLLELTGEFSVSLLADGQAEVAVRAARHADADDTFAEHRIPVAEPPAGYTAPAVAGAAAVYWCAVESAVPTHQALVVVGRVLHHSESDAGPLLRHRRRYRALGAAITVAEEAPYPL
jgi:flavin reductase (DIM6/NTAB) family NADH-FMN oxidoreductase RutF